MLFPVAGVSAQDFPVLDDSIVKDIEEVYNGGEGGAVEHSYALLEEIKQPLPRSIKIGEECKKQVEVKDRLYGSSMLAFTVQGIDNYPSRPAELAYVYQEIL